MLLDTSGLLALLFIAESQHSDSASRFKNAGKKLVHSYVLAELVALAQARKYPRVPVLAFIRDLLVHPQVEMIWVEEALHQDAVALLEARPDKAYSLCDATSFVLMKRYGITEALTTDHHFEQEGFLRLLNP